MKTKRANEIFGYIIFGLGVIKTIFILLLLIRISFNFVRLFENGDLNNYYYPILSKITSYLEIIVFLISFVMVFVNIKKEPGLIRWYLLCIGAFLLALFIPPIIFVFFALPQCVMYLNAGVKIRNAAAGVTKNYKKAKQDLKNTEWFYGKEDEIKK